MVYKFSSSYEYVGMVSIEEAIQDVYAGRAVTILADNRVYRSPSTEIQVPKAIRMTRGKSFLQSVPLNSANIFRRDNNTCQYEGCSARNNLTVDHVIPQHYFKRETNYKYTKINPRAKMKSWENLVTACSGCNTRKANRTPEEAGMRLKRKPVKPLARDLVDTSWIWEEMARQQAEGA